MNEPILELTDVDKTFFHVPVLQHVSLQVVQGKTLGLVGENGAGKSTLMNILGGNLAADSGQMTLAGRPYAPASPRDAEEAGVAFIHQELNLFGNLSIAENLFLTRFPRKLAWIDRRKVQRLATTLLDRVGLDLSPRLLIEDLSAGERQLVEIAKALSLQPRLIIFDEPTTSLTERETEHLFHLIQDLQSQGITMIYISHALGEVRQLCDNICVLRDGQIVGRGRIEEFNDRRLIALMVGRQVDQQFPPRVSHRRDELALQVEGVSQPGMVHDISFVLHRGEVLGIAGLMGSGRTELARILFGLDPMSSGTIRFNGTRVEKRSTRQRVRRGMAMLTENRRLDGLCMPESVEFNMQLVCAPQYASGPVKRIRKDPLQQAVRSMGESVRLTGATNLRQPVRTLSGGNQQKVVLGKWLLNEPHVLILDEPTRGIDVGAKYEIYLLIDRLAAGGASVLVISSEIDELIGICDRILVMSRGEVQDELQRDEFQSERILQAALRFEETRGETS